MKRKLLDRLLCLLVLVVLFVAALVSRLGAGEPQGWMKWGAWPMCVELPAECRPYAARQVRVVELTDERQMLLDRINRQVNNEIEYQTDIEHYGLMERWTYPADGRGDCEDFVLEKRRRLVALGWPRRALLIAIVKVPGTEGELHAVLIARTNFGDMVLDQRRPAVMERNSTGYGFRWVQSQSQPWEYTRQGLSS